MDYEFKSDANEAHNKAIPVAPKSLHLDNNCNISLQSKPSIIISTTINPTNDKDCHDHILILKSTVEKVCHLPSFANPAIHHHISTPKHTPTIPPTTTITRSRPTMINIPHPTLSNRRTSNKQAKKAHQTASSLLDELRTSS